MCVLHVVTYHGCGCKIPGTYFCEPALDAVHRVLEDAVACAHISLPPVEIERDHACFLPRCPKKSKFEPWRCCMCGEGPNDTTLCTFKIEEVPDFLKDCKECEGYLCHHNLCMKCPKYRYVSQKKNNAWARLCLLAYHGVQLGNGGHASWRGTRSGAARWSKFEAAASRLF